MIKVGNDSFLQTQFGPKASETISQRRFCQNYSYVKERFRIKVGNNSFLQSQFGPKASETISQRRFLLKIKMIHISILSFSLNSVRKRLKRFLREGFWVRVRVRVRVYLFAKQRLFWVFKIISSGAPRAPIRRSAHHNDRA